MKPVTMTRYITLNVNPGEKFLVRWFRGYLISVTFGGRVGGGRAAALTSSQSGTSENMTLTIYDIQNQFVGKVPSTLPDLDNLYTSLSLPVQHTRPRLTAV